MGLPGSGKPTDDNEAKQQSNTKENLLCRDWVLDFSPVGPGVCWFSSEQTVDPDADTDT